LRTIEVATADLAAEKSRQRDRPVGTDIP